MTKEAYVVTFSWPVYVWADNEDDANDKASLFGEDESGFGDNFDKLEIDATTILRGSIYPRMFMNPEDEPEEVN